MRLGLLACTRFNVLTYSICCFLARSPCAKAVPIICNTVNHRLLHSSLRISSWRDSSFFRRSAGLAFTVSSVNHSSYLYRRHSVFVAAFLASSPTRSTATPIRVKPPLPLSLLASDKMTVSTSASTSSFPPTMEAQLTSDVDRAGDYLRAGGLVAFPTETVYGLGANAYLEKSVRRIFEVKGRPLTDPLIVHVAQIEEAWSVFACGGNTTYHHAASSNSVPHVEVRAAEEEKKEKDLLSTLAHAFWPGPLTLVAPAAAAIPSAVTAETGWVGVRVPSHSLARALLRAAAVPVVAPSANRFGHVSPTSAAHVQADLGGHSLLILKEKEEHRAGQGACEIGIESTVAKVDAREGRVTILRAGAVTCSQLESALRGKGVEVVVKGHARQQEEQPKAKAHGEAGGDVMPKELRTEDLTNDENKPQIAPGQCLKHYAPDRPTYLLSALQATESWVDLLASRAVILDMGGRLQRLKGLAAHYMDLSETGDVREAAAGLFQALRWAESVDGGKGKLELEEDLLVLIVDLGREGNRREGQGRTAEGEDAEFAVALIDRIMRSASGQAAGPFLVSP